MKSEPEFKARSPSFVQNEKPSGCCCKKRSRGWGSSEPSRDTSFVTDRVSCSLTGGGGLAKDKLIEARAKSEFAKDNLILTKRHYFYVIIFQTLYNIYSTIYHLIQKEHLFAGLAGLSLGCTLLAAVFLKYISRPGINFLVFALMFVTPASLYGFQYSHIVGHTPDQIAEQNPLELVLNLFVLEIHTYIITMNQRPLFYTLTTILNYWVAFPLVWPSPFFSSIWPYSFLAMMSIIHLILRRRSNRDMLLIYIKKIEAKHKLYQKRSLLQLISTAPIFILKVPDIFDIFQEEALYATNLSSQPQGKPPSRGRLDSKARLRTRLQEYGLKISSVYTQEAQSVTTFKLVNFLEKLKFSKNSSIICPQNQHLQIYDQSQKKLLREILEFPQLDDDAFDIIFMMYRKLVDKGMKHFEVLFRLQAMELSDQLSNESSMLMNSSTIFDVEFKFTDYDNSIALVIILKDYSEKQILSRLQMINKEKETGLVAVVNDMRIPMNAVKNYTKSVRDLLEKGLHNELDVIDANCEHLNLLIHDIIDNGFMHNHKLNLKVSKFSMSKLVEDCMTVIESMKGPKALSLLTECPKGIWMHTDYHRLKRIVLNLLTNSLKYTFNGFIKIEVGVVDRCVEVQVRDTGIGLDKESLDRLFEEFACNIEKDAEDKEANKIINKEGIGLGLVTCLNLVETLGPKRKIEVTSSKNVGSCFSFQVFRDYYSIGTSKSFIKKPRQNSVKDCARPTVFDLLNRSPADLFTSNEIRRHKDSSLAKNSVCSKILTQKTPLLVIYNQPGNEPSQVRALFEDYFNTSLKNDFISETQFLPSESQISSLISSLTNKSAQTLLFLKVPTPDSGPLPSPELTLLSTLCTYQQEHPSLSPLSLFLTHPASSLPSIKEAWLRLSPLPLEKVTQGIMQDNVNIAQFYALMNQWRNRGKG